MSARPSWQVQVGDSGWAPPPAQTYIGWLAPFMGGILMTMGSLLGWAIIDGYGSIPGVSHQGVITLVLGLSSLALGVMLAVGLNRTLGFVLTALIAVGAIAVAVINLIDIPAQLGDSATIGAGLYVILLGSLITLVGSIAGALKRPLRYAR
jgi:hypothetical protein